MNHLHSFEQFSLLEKEGILQTIGNKAKELLGINSIWKIRYTVTTFEEEEKKEEKHEKKGKEKEEKSKKEKHKEEPKPEKEREYSTTVTLKAHNKTAAKEKFNRMWNKAVKDMKPQPTRRINSIKRTEEMENKTIEIYENKINEAIGWIVAGVGKKEHAGGFIWKYKKSNI